MNSESTKTHPVCSGNCKSADMKDCVDVYTALNELQDAIRTDLDDTGYRDYSEAITHVVMNSVVNWFYYHVEKIKLIEGDSCE